MATKFIRWDDNLEEVKEFFKPGKFGLPRAIRFKPMDDGRLKITRVGEPLVIFPGQFISKDLEVLS